MNVSVLGTPGQPVGLPGHPSRISPQPHPSPWTMLWCLWELEHRVASLSLWLGVPSALLPFVPTLQQEPSSDLSAFLKSSQAGPRLGQSLLMLSLKLLNTFSLS